MAQQTFPTIQPKRRNRKVRIAILVVSLVIIILIGFALLSGLIEFNIGTPFSPSIKNTTTSMVILQDISVFEDQAGRKLLQKIDWGHVESNHSYSQTFDAKNDHATSDMDDRDIVWQRLNVNPNSVCISIKVDYGDMQIKPNEIRQAVITLTVLGLFDSIGRLNPNAEIPQFTFDLKLTGKWLNHLFPYYAHTYALRDANNITVVYKDELEETISVIVEIGVWKTKSGEQVIEMVWNSTKYVSEFTDSWLEADRYTSYQLVVTINHERYGVFTYRNYLVGQIHP